MTPGVHYGMADSVGYGSLLRLARSRWQSDTYRCVHHARPVLDEIGQHREGTGLQRHLAVPQAELPQLFMSSKSAKRYTAIPGPRRRARRWFGQEMVSY